MNEVRREIERCSKGQFVILGELVEEHNSVTVVCRACNNSFESSVVELLARTDCPACSTELNPIRSGAFETSH